MPRVAVVIFGTLWIVAMITYPGWNAFDPTSTSHDFSRNFLCDLLSARTPDGRSNFVGSIAMNAGAVALVLGSLLPLWWHAPVSGRWRTSNRLLGGVATALTLAICVEQAFAIPLPHGVITLAAGAAGLVPTAVVAVVDWRSSDGKTIRRALLLVMLIASLVNFVSYAFVQNGGELTLVVPVTQKVALVCLLAWLCLKPASTESPALS